MASIKEEIAAIAADHGYTGPKPKSTAGAIDALADTLAGTDVKSGRSIAGAIHSIAPYIGSGGGGGSLGVGYAIANANGKMVQAYATRPDDILTALPNIQFTADNTGYVILPAGVYACVMAESNSTVVDDEDNVIESEIVEIEQGGTTLYIICFVMPDADVLIA